MRVEREVSLVAAREDHPSQIHLERFMRCELPPAESSAVVRHLLTGCPQCRRVTGWLWNFRKGKPMGLKRRRGKLPASEPGRPPLRCSEATRIELEEAAQERLLERADVLEELAGSLLSIAKALPPPREVDPETEDVTVELRAVIDCVLTEEIRPAIGHLRAAAYFPAEPPGEAGDGEGA